MLDFTREEVIARVAAGQDLRRADLNQANLSKSDLSGAQYNKHTKFPDGFDPEAAGMVLVE
jgi:uncharacterized protein YjbI with pentapeptide repeats